MDLIQRLPRAVLVTVLSLLFFGGTTGMVVAAGEPDVPQRMSMASPHVGDRWQYELDMYVEGLGESFAQRMVLSYEWLPAELLQDAHGSWRSVHPLFEQWGFGEHAEWNAYLVDAASGEVVANRDRLAGGSSSVSQSFVSGVPISQRTTQEFTEYVTTRFAAAPPFCGYRSDLQGGHVATAGVHLDGFCGLDLDHELGAAFGGRFQPVETEEVAGMQALRLQRADDIVDSDMGITFDVDVWLVPHVSYPVKIQYSMDFEVPDFGPFEFAMIMTMTGFEPGHEPWGQSLSLPATGVPTVLTAPRMPWGPDDTAIQHPFRFSEAWHLAKQDPVAGEWFEDHPDAAAMAANFTQVAFEDRTELQWVAWVVAGRDQQRLEVTRVVRDDGPLSMLLGLAGDVQVEMADIVRDVPKDMPEHAPAVRSVQDRWQAMRPDAGAANAYGFWPSCACPGAYWAVAGGRVEAADSTPTIHNPADPAMTEFTEDRDMLIVGARAMPEALQTMARHGSTYERGLVDLGTQAGPQDVEDDGMATMSMSSQMWGFPPAPAAASVVAGAFAVGLLYWLWPAIKSGGLMGLFSRVHKDALLEHPTRRSIHDAIQASPGIHYQGLIRTIGKGRGTVEHHVHKLQQGGYIVAHRNDGHTCFFVRGAMDHSVMAAVPAVRTPAAARVLSHIQAHPGLRVGEIGLALGLARSTASHHVKRLKEAGLVTSWANGALSATAIAGPALHAVAA